MTEPGRAGSSPDALRASTRLRCSVVGLLNVACRDKLFTPFPMIERAYAPVLRHMGFAGSRVVTPRTGTPRRCGQWVRWRAATHRAPPDVSPTTPDASA